jgi:inner membrane protein involved in colicin E2 resistance
MDWSLWFGPATAILAAGWLLIGAFLGWIIKRLRWSVSIFLLLAVGYGIFYGRLLYRMGDGPAAGSLAGLIMFAIALPGLATVVLVARWARRRRRDGSALESSPG